MGVRDITKGLGKGLIAGAAGTAAMTAASTLEMKLRKREPSTTPAEAAEKILDVEPTDDEAEQRLNNVAHWSYGTGWGIPRAVIGAAGLRGLPAGGLHFAAIWGAALVMLPRMRLAPPVKKWGAKEIAIDGFHHLVYAAGAGLVYDALSRRDA